MLEDRLEKWANRTLLKFKMPSWAGVRGWLALLCRKGAWRKGWLSGQGAQAVRAAATHWSV